jgi:hypothetical protein
MGRKLGRGGFTHNNNLVQTKTHVKSILFLLSITSSCLSSPTLYDMCLSLLGSYAPISCVYACIGLGCMRYVFVFVLSRVVFVPCRSPSADDEFPLTLETLEISEPGVGRVVRSMQRRRYLGLW